MSIYQQTAGPEVSALRCGAPQVRTIEFTRFYFAEAIFGVRIGVRYRLKNR
jgi:hypothetical protein